MRVARRRASNAPAGSQGNSATVPIRFPSLGCGGVHGGTHLIANRRVLIVNGSKDSREVLKTALERRGLEILEAAASQEGLLLAQRHRPHVIVLDAEDDPVGEDAACDRFKATSDRGNASLVVLGSARLCQTVKRRADEGISADSGGSIVAKPYHFGPLIRKIEELAG